MIRLTIPSIDDDDLEAVRETLLSGQLVQGHNVAAFERAVAEYVGVAHAVAVSNCTSALFLALCALDVRTGDKIAVTAYSWPATANVIVLCGAEPVFVDIDAATFNMDAGLLDDALKTQSIKAILPVHAFGAMADMRSISEVASRHRVPIIEDAACALGAQLEGRHAGTWSKAGCFSFHPRKAVTTGEGGVVTTNDAAFAARIRALRNHGQDPQSPAPDFIMAGHNMRLTEFQGALGRTQMAKLERIIGRRTLLASNYVRLLEPHDLAVQGRPQSSRHVYQSFVTLLPRELRHQQRYVIGCLARAGVESTIGTYHVPLTRFYRERFGHRPGDFPVCDEIAARALSLPLHEALTEDAQGTVVSALLSAIQEASERGVVMAGRE